MKCQNKPVASLRGFRAVKSCVLWKSLFVPFFHPWHSAVTSVLEMLKTLKITKIACDVLTIDRSIVFPLLLLLAHPKGQWCAPIRDRFLKKASPNLPSSLSFVLVTKLGSWSVFLSMFWICVGSHVHFISWNAHLNFRTVYLARWLVQSLRAAVQRHSDLAPKVKRMSSHEPLQAQLWTMT